MGIRLMVRMLDLMNDNLMTCDRGEQHPCQHDHEM